MRAAHLIPRLEPRRHEYYAGAALENLAETDFPTADLIHLIKTLDQRGFTSGSFRDGQLWPLQSVLSGIRAFPTQFLPL
jgi:hypothetical protein